jgi:transposase
MIADLPRGAMLLADKGYDANALRATVCEHDAWANIPPKANRKDPICFSPYLYKARNLIERFFNKIKHYRRIATRYDKLAENYLAALKLVAVRIWLRRNESTSLGRKLIKPVWGFTGRAGRDSSSRTGVLRWAGMS